MTKYKVGDKVRIRADLKENRDILSCFGCTEEMRKLAGKEAKITHMSSELSKPIIYRLDIDNELNMWDEVCFVPCEGNTSTQEQDIYSNFRIKEYKVIPKKAVIVRFSDGDEQKAVCVEGDVFDEERGLEVCVMKHMLGKSKYHKLLREADKQLKVLEQKEEIAKEAEEIRKRKVAKKAERKARRAEKERQERIAERKEAYLAALKEYGEITFDEEEDGK